MKAAHAHECTVLKLPVARCDFNPIELVWASVKGYIKHDKTHNLPEMEQLTPDRITYTTTDMWRIFCRHVVDIKNDYFEKYKFFEDTIESKN